MPGQHALIAPSSLHRTVVCAAHVGLEAAMPEEPPTPESMEGDAAHWCNQETARTGYMPALGSLAPNGVAITEEMHDGTAILLSDIAARMGGDWRSKVFTETRIQIPGIHPVHCWGTPDHRGWLPAAHTTPDGRPMYLARNWDYKFGFDIVDAVENWQNIGYSRGMLDEVLSSDIRDDQIIFELIVVQPRAPHKLGPVRVWRVLAADLRQYYNIAEAAAHKALAPNPPAVPSADGCKNCRARLNCEANQRAAWQAKSYAGMSTPQGLNNYAKGMELRALQQAKAILEARCEALEADIDATIRGGGMVPLWSRESTPGRLAWTCEPSEVEVLGTMFGVDLMKDPQPITPTQAKERIKKAGASPDIVDVYASRPVGSTKLVYDDGRNAALVFSKSSA